VIIDEYSRWLTVYGMNNKSKSLNTFKKYLLDVQAMGNEHRVKSVMSEHRVKGVRSDNAGEFRSQEFQEFCKSKGIKQSFSGPYAPQQMGIVERANRTLFDMIRCLLTQGKLSKELWGEAANTAAYIINRLPTTALDGDTPYHKVYGKEGKVSHLRVFGCATYVHVYSHKRQKLDDKAWRGILVGYDESNWRCYRVYDPVKQVVYRSVHATFNESEFPGTGDVTTEWNLVDDADSDELVPHRKDKSDNEGEAVEIEVDEVNQNVNDDVHDNLNLLPRNTNLLETGEMEEPPRVPHREFRWCNNLDCDIQGIHRAHLTMDFALSVVEGINVLEDPMSYQEAMKSTDRAKWVAAMRDEYESLCKANTWELAPKPLDVNVIGSRWLFKTKRDNHGNITRYKARLVAQGFTQEFGRDYLETFSPVAKLTSIRLVLYLANANDWELENMDVQTAFLNSPVQELIYIKQPRGYEKYDTDGKPLVCRMIKSLYGLKQSSRNELEPCN
jgi:hypothetical protein